MIVNDKKITTKGKKPKPKVKTDAARSSSFSVVSAICWLLSIFIGLSMVFQSSWAGLEGWSKLGLFLPGLAVMCFLLLKTQSGRLFPSFSQSCVHELYKVHWPSRPEVMQMALVVIVIAFVVSLFLWFVDSMLLQLVAVLLGTA